jgi:hypothetical protein
MQLSQHQLEWIIGRNPFSQSAMWGEGYDFTPLYAPFPGDIVGALPVGIQTRGDNDVPYWPVQSTWTYKEVWSHPDCRWIWIMRDLAGPALIEGQSQSDVEFTEATTGQVITVPVESTTGHFRAMIPEGQYRINCRGGETTRTFLPAGTYFLDLRRGMTLDYQVSHTTSAIGDVTIRVSAKGTGAHKFNIRSENLALSHPQSQIILKPGIPGVLEWRGRIISRETPWIAVAVPDEDLTQKQEMTGSVWAR